MEKACKKKVIVILNEPKGKNNLIRGETKDPLVMIDGYCYLPNIKDGKSFVSIN